MLNKITDLTNALGSNTDKLITSKEEMAKQYTKRHLSDMGSDNWLAKSIRPLTLLILLFLQIVIVILGAFEYTVSETIVIQHGVLLATFSGFYVQSRKSEKIADKNASANLKLEKMKTKASIKERRRELRKR